MTDVGIINSSMEVLDHLGVVVANGAIDETKTVVENLAQNLGARVTDFAWEKIKSIITNSKKEPSYNSQVGEIIKFSKKIAPAEDTIDLWARICAKAMIGENSYFRMDFLKFIEEMSPRDAKIIIFILNWQKKSDYRTSRGIDVDMFEGYRYALDTSNSERHRNSDNKLLEIRSLWSNISTFSNVSSYVFVDRAIQSELSIEDFEEAFDLFSSRKLLSCNSNNTPFSLSPLGRAFMKALQVDKPSS